MPRIPGLRRYVRVSGRSDTLTTEIDDELAFHFDMTVRDLVARGHTPEEARREARRRFGDVERTRATLESIDRGRAELERRAHRMGALTQDVRYALRGMRRAPGFTAVVVVTLALGIGANAAMFGIVDRLLLRPPSHITEPDRVARVALESRDGALGLTYGEPFSFHGYSEFRRRVPSFADAAAYFTNPMNAGRGVDAEQVRASLVTGNFFELLGTRPAAGRLLSAGDDSARAPVAVIGYGFWQRRYALDRRAVGRAIDVNGRLLTVVGVAPRGFTGLELRPIDVWIPISVLAPDVVGSEWATGDNWYWVRTVARLRDGASFERATAELTAVYRGLKPEQWRQQNPHARAIASSVIPARAPTKSDEARVAAWLAAVSAIVVLIACANVANLLLARAVRRRREIAVRAALGIGRWRLATQLLTESVLLAICGGLAAIAVAHWGGELIRATLLPEVAREVSFLDRRVLGFAALVALATGLATGVAPILHVLRYDLTDALRAGARGGTYHRSPLRLALLVSQAALAALLLVGAGLFVRSLRNVAALDLGFSARSVVVAEVDFTGSGVATDEQLVFYDRALERVQSLRGVTSASLSVTVPFYTSVGTRLSVPGVDSVPSGPDGGPFVNAVSPDYFATMGMRILRGRGFTATDRRGSERVVVVNESLARALWPGRDALGRCMRVGGDTVPCATVVGVVADAHRDQIRSGGSFLYYVSLEQDVWQAPPMRALFVRAAGDAGSLVPAVRRELQSALPSLPYANARPLEDLLAPQIRPWRLGATMFGVFGLLALLVASVGLYSVIAYDVAQRTQELGVRVALGASGRDVMGLVVGQGVKVTAVGVSIGLLLALAAGGGIATLLFRVSPRDPLVYAAVAGTLVAVAALASLLPAWRASRIDPATTLRAET